MERPKTTRAIRNRDSDLIYQIPGLEPIPTTNVEGLPQIRPGQNIPLTNEEWFPWVREVNLHRITVHKETNETWSGREKARARQLELVKADERYWFNTFAAVYEARTQAFEDQNLVYDTVAEARSEARKRSRSGSKPFILYPFQDYWLTWVGMALRTVGGKGDTITIKSRDMGMSNTGVGHFAHAWLTEPGFQGRLISRIEDVVDKSADPDSLFWKLDSMLRSTPRWMLGMLVPNFDWLTHRRHMTLENPNSMGSIRGVATSANALRAGRAQEVLVDEFAVIQGFKGIWEGIRATTEHRHAIGSVSTSKGMDAYNTVMSGRHAVIRMDSRTGMHPQQSKEWHELQRSRDDDASYAQEVGMDWFKDAGDFVYPEFAAKQLEIGHFPYEPFEGPVFCALDDGVHWAIWFLQYIERTGRIHVLDFYRNKGQRTDFYGALLNGLYHADFSYGGHEHDIIKLIQEIHIDHFVGDAHAQNWESGTGMSVNEDLAQKWNIYVQVDWRKRDYVSRKDDLTDLIRSMDFNDTPRMAEGLRSLAMYRYRGTPEGKEVAKEQREPLHNDNSHAATAMERFASNFEGLRPVFSGRPFIWAAG